MHDGQPVADEVVLAASPHPHGGMVLPAVGAVCQRVEYLQGLHPLLAKAAIVEGHSGGAERWVWQEGLHYW